MHQRRALTLDVRRGPTRGRRSPEPKATGSNPVWRAVRNDADERQFAGFFRAFPQSERPASLVQKATRQDTSRRLGGFGVVMGR